MLNTVRRLPTITKPHCSNELSQRQPELHCADCVSLVNGDPHLVYPRLSSQSTKCACIGFACADPDGSIVNQYAASLTAQAVQVESYLENSLYPVLCSTVPGRVQVLKGLEEGTQRAPLLLRMQVSTGVTKFLSQHAISSIAICAEGI